MERNKINPLQELQEKFYLEYKLGKITLKELQEKLEESFYDFNQD